MNNIIFSILKLVNEHCPFTTDNSKQNTCPENCKRGPYYDFSPIDVCEDEDKSSYQEEFNQIKYALENDKVKNLAVLGKFGTGKSSLVSSFFKHAQINNKKISEKEYVTVSLADFDYLKGNSSDNIEDDLAANSRSDKDNNSDTTDKKGCNESSENKIDSSNKNNHSSGKSSYQNLESVEKEIIRQLSYGKLSKNVPISFLSKFKTRLCDTFVISLYLSPLLVLFLSSFFIKDEIVHLFNYTPVSTLTKLLVLTAITVAYVFIFFKFLSPRLRFKHLSLSSLSISVEQRDSDNIIDAYLDEITYLFEQSECKYVIFEDLDRGNNPEVFTHIRNLNIVLNNDIRCKNKNGFFWKKCQRRIVFIYLLRNDLLSPQEMVKFFDYTISITPYSASSNIAFHALKIRDELYAYYKKIEDGKSLEDELNASQDFGDNVPANQQYKITQMSSESKIFKRSKLFTEEALDNDFIISVSRFVGDLRNVKQIFNDYQLLIGNFEFLFEDSKNIAKKLFSISALKNYYPSDYNQLLSNNGKLYELMNRKGEYRSFVENVKNYFKDLNDKNDRLSSENFDQYEWNRSFENLEEQYSFYDLVKSKRYKAELCTYLRNKTFLSYLLCSDFISEDYRFYVSKFSKKFCLDKKHYSFLRNVYDKNSIYEPNCEIISKKNELDVLLSFLPDNAVCSKAILNYHLFSFLLHNYINYQSVIHNYIGVIFKGKYKQQGYIFLLELCSLLNEELKNKNKIKLNDQTKLNILTYLFIKSNVNIKDVIDVFENPVQKSEFLLFVLIYGIQQNLSNIINSNNNFFNGLKSLVNVKAYSTYILKGLNNIPQMYWKYLFSSLRYLYVELEYAPTSKILAGNLKEFYFHLDQWLIQNDGSKNKSLKYYLPFKINCENCSALAYFLTSCLKEFDKNTASQDLNCSNSFWSVLFDFKSEDEPSFLNIRKTIFNYIFEQNQFTEKNRYLRLLSVSAVIDKFNNLSKDESVTYLEDNSEIVVSLITVLNALEIHKRLDKEKNSIDKDNDLDKQKTVKKELTSFLRQDEYFSLLNKYRCVKYIFNSSTHLLKQCYLDFENFCIEDLKITFSKVDSLLQSWQDGNFYDLYTIDLNFALAKVETLSDLFRYSFLPKVNQITPPHRIKPNIQNIMYVRDFLCSFDLSNFSNDNKEDNKTSFIFDFFNKEIDTAWNSLYEFFKLNFDEILQSSSHLISCQKFEDLDPKKIKEFFLNLDKQD